MYKKYTVAIIKFIFPVCSMLIFAFLACGQRKKEYKSPVGYNLNKPYIIQLPVELADVSGLAYYKKDNALFAESDTKGSLYKIFLAKPTDIKKWKFGHSRDYEDIVLLDSNFYILNSNGDIVMLNFVNDVLMAHEFKFPGKESNEFESLFYDDQQKKLVMVCKNCEADDKTSTSTYTFDPQQSAYYRSFIINTQSIVNASPQEKKFKPSGATINPLTGEVYILSSINKVIVVTGRDGVIKAIYNLDPLLYNHPEGITFTPEGNLFISNEGDKTHAPTIFFFKKY